MTLPKIDSLSPDQIRVMIAEAVGWVKVREHWRKGDDVVFLNHSCNHQQLPDYPTDANAVLTLCAWMKTQGWVWRANNDETHSEVCFQFVNDEFAFESSADTLPLAICKAFLIANNLAQPS